MDDARFDHLAKLLTKPTSRRRGIGRLALLGLGATRSAPGDAHANKECNPNQQRCGKRCIPRARCCTNADCPRASGQSCQNSRCRCRRGKKRCAGACIADDRCCTDVDCGPFDPCLGNTCVVGLGTCSAGTGICDGTASGSCNGSATCACYRDQQGRTRCAEPVNNIQDCTSDASCAAFGVGAFCQTERGTCGGNFCLLPCPQ